MTRPIYGSRPLKTTELLACRNAGRGRPALSDLRRAASTAYYALFHQIIRHGTCDFLPGASESEIAEITRRHTHTGVLRAANSVVRAASAEPLTKISKPERPSVMVIRAAGGGVVDTDVPLIAGAFQTRQEARPSAGYDGNYDPVRLVMLNHIDDARTAVKKTRSPWRERESPELTRGQAHACYQSFPRLALLQSGTPKAR